MTKTSDRYEWLSLIDVSGPFLAEPVLNDVFPQGLEAVDGDARPTLPNTEGCRAPSGRETRFSDYADRAPGEPADGDARGGAALSIRQLTGKPMRLLLNRGSCEKVCVAVTSWVDRCESNK